MKIGALTVNADQDIVSKFAELGELIGLGVQLRDDIFDYYDDNVGKPTGNDIREGKITLPLLHAFKNTNEREHKQAMSIVQDKNFTDENIDYLINFAKENGGIDYTYSVLEQTIDKANKIVDNLNLSSNDLKESFLAVIQYLKERKY